MDATNTDAAGEHADRAAELRADAAEPDDAADVADMAADGQPPGAIDAAEPELIDVSEASEAAEVAEASEAAEVAAAEVSEVPERFAEVMESLATVGQLPLPERVEVFASAHSRLQDALTSIDEV